MPVKVGLMYGPSHPFCGSYTDYRRHCAPKSHISPWHMRQLNPVYFHFSLLYIPFSLFIFSILLYRQTRDRRKARGCRRHIQRPVAPETSAFYWPLSFLNKRINPKRMAVDSAVASTDIFLLFTSFFVWTDKDSNYLLPTDLPGIQLPSHGATGPNYLPGSPSGHSISGM